MRVRPSLLWVFAVAAAITLFGYFALPTFSTIQSTPSGVFSVTPETVRLNWTNNYNSNITLGAMGVGNLTFTVVNSTSLIGNYSQSNSLSACANTAFTLFVQNNTNSSYFNTTSQSPINDGELVSLNLTDPSAHRQCLPGRYWASNYTIRAANGTTSNENATMRVIVDIPISSSNDANSNLETTGAGTFSGSISAAVPLFNSSAYQSYYFNTSAVANATAVTVNLTGWSSGQYVNMFLFDDQGVQRAKSINMNTSQLMSYNYLPATPKMWEIRISGNSTSSIPYTGYIIFSTLNVTNQSAPYQQVTAMSFDNLNAGQMVNSNMTITNQGGLNERNVVLSSVMYRIQKFSGSGSQNFRFLVGDNTFESKIFANLLWTGSSDYTFNIYNPSGVLYNSSSNYYQIANVSNANAVEVFNETTALTPGYWTASVVSNNGGSDSYNLNVSIYQSQTWISTNYTTSSFNGLGTNATIQVNLTVPNNTIDGAYAGSLLLTDENRGTVVIPVAFNVTAPTLFVFNKTSSPVSLNPLNSSTGNVFRIDENIGATLNKSVNINLTNAGTVDLTVDMSSNSSYLTCTSCAAAYTANLTYNTTVNITHQTSQLIQINVTFNSTLPVGTYDGWIFINASNQTGSLSSHPYSGYNLTVRLNLTNRLNLIPQFFGSLLGTNISSPQSSNETANVTMSISYINGTALDSPYSLNVTNFSVFLQESNVTSSLGNITGLLISNGTNPIFFNNKYSINFSVPQQALGGLYFVNPAVTYIRPSDGTTFYGSGRIGVLQIADTGLFMSSNFSGCPGFGTATCPSGAATLTVGGSAQTIHVNVTNYGGLSNSSLSEAINFTYSGCNGYTVAATSSGSGCSSGSISSSGTQWTLTNMPAVASCLLVWTITPSSAASACSGRLTVSRPSIWFDSSGINITTTVNAASSTTTTSTASSAASNPSSSTGSSASTPQYLSISSYPSMIIVQQGRSNSTSVSVKNINNTKTQNISLQVSTAGSNWTSVSPSVRSLILPNSSTSFTVTFTIPSDVAVNDYNSQFTATSSLGSVSNNFTLRVTPSAETAIQINNTLQQLILNYTQLSQQINESKAAGLNTTAAEATLALLTAKVQAAQDAIKSGDYFTVSQLEGEISQILNQGYAALSSAQGANPFSFLNNFVNIMLSFFNLQQNGKYAVVAIAVAVSLILTYFYWPKIRERFGQKATAAAVKRTVSGGEQATSSVSISAESEEDNAWDALKQKWAEYNKKKKQE